MPRESWAGKRASDDHWVAVSPPAGRSLCSELAPELPLLWLVVLGPGRALSFRGGG